MRGHSVVNGVTVQAGLQVQLRGAAVTKNGACRVDVLAEEACERGDRRHVMPLATGQREWFL